MSQLIFTSIEDIDNIILEKLDIASFINVCKINKRAYKYGNNDQLWIPKFENEHIILYSGFNFQKFTDWTKYYHYRDYVSYMNFKQKNEDSFFNRPFNCDYKFIKLEDNIQFRNDILIIQETDNSLDYRHIYIEIRSGEHQPVFKAMNYLTYQSLDFDLTYNEYQQFRFKYRKNEYWLFLGLRVFKFDTYPDEVEDLKDYFNKNEYRIRLTEKEFKLLLTLIIYADDYINIVDHAKRSFIACNLTFDNEYDHRREGMLQVLEYLRQT